MTMIMKKMKKLISKPTVLKQPAFCMFEYSWNNYEIKSLRLNSAELRFGINFIHIFTLGRTWNVRDHDISYEQTKKNKFLSLARLIFDR